MVEVVKTLEKYIGHITAYIKEASEEEMTMKPNPTKWSKKEILGHLVDSGINNLQRFTEIQFTEKPYVLRAYKQDELVKANHYQNAKTYQLLELLTVINQQIIHVILQQSGETLKYQIVYLKNDQFDLKYLIEDYVLHFEHHMKQILE